VDVTYLYWTDTVAKNVRRVSIDGGLPTVLASAESDRGDIVTDGKGNVFWSAYGTAVMEVGRPGGGPNQCGIGSCTTTTLWHRRGDVRDDPRRLQRHARLRKMYLSTDLRRRRLVQPVRDVRADDVHGGRRDLRKRLRRLPRDTGLRSLFGLRDLRGQPLHLRTNDLRSSERNLRNHTRRLWRHAHLRCGL